MVHYTEPLLIERLRRKVKLPRTAGLVLGIGDGCAIFRPRGGAEDLLFTTDMLIENVHFERRTHPAADAGWKALARGLSDIAAMGGTPAFCLLSLAIAPWVDARWIDGFYRGLLAHRVPLLGGDLARTDRMMADIVVAGGVPRGTALRRGGRARGGGSYGAGGRGGFAPGLTLRPAPRGE